MKTLATIKCAVQGQVRTSRNLKDSLWRKCQRVFWGAVLLLKAFWLGLRALRREQGLSAVIYQGRRCYISNWAGSDNPTLAGDGFYMERVPRAEITNVINVQELAHRFHMGLSFYLGSWYDIDVNKRVNS